MLSLDPPDPPDDPPDPPDPLDDPPDPPHDLSDEPPDPPDPPDPPPDLSDEPPDPPHDPPDPPVDPPPHDSPDPPPVPPDFQSRVWAATRAVDADTGAEEWCIWVKVTSAPTTANAGRIFPAFFATAATCEGAVCFPVR